MIRRGTTAFADMYYFMDEVARARAGRRHAREHLPRLHQQRRRRFRNSSCMRTWHDKGDGRIKVYMGVQRGITTSTPEVVRYASDADGEEAGHGISRARVRIRTDETPGAAFERRGCSPVEYFRRLAAYTKNPTIAARTACRRRTRTSAFLRENRVYVAHNPSQST
jgi:5-methylthioadenosine/S-adenosylhomocysteine deaminase